jgi:hypothetical protein
MTSAVRAEREQSLRELDRELDFIGKNYPASEVRRVVKTTAFEALHRVMRRTPVLKGRTKANWQVTLGQPATEVVDRVDPSGAATIAAGEAVISALRDGFPVVWLTNNHPAALVIEEGGYPLNPKKGTYMPERRTRSGRRIKAHYEIRSAGGYSKRSPRGMVAVTVQELLQMFERVEVTP